MLRTTRMSALLVAATATSLLLVGCGSSAVDATTRDATGAVASAGTLGVEKLRVGDCVDVGDVAKQAEADVESFTGVPCSDPHHEEVYLVDKNFYADLPTTYPGDTKIGDLADEGCYDAFEKFTGEPYTEKSEIDWVSITPTPDGWVQGDRALVCAVVTPTADGNDLEKTTGSLKG